MVLCVKYRPAIQQGAQSVMNRMWHCQHIEGGGGGEVSIIISLNRTKAHERKVKCDCGTWRELKCKVCWVGKLRVNDHFDLIQLFLCGFRVPLSLRPKFLVTVVHWIFISLVWLHFGNDDHHHHRPKGYFNSRELLNNRQQNTRGEKKKTWRYKTPLIFTNFPAEAASTEEVGQVLWLWMPRNIVISEQIVPANESPLSVIITSTCANFTVN